MTPDERLGPLTASNRTPANGGVLRSVGWSLAFAVALAVLYAVLVVTPWGQQLDVRGLGLPAASAMLLPFEWLRVGIPFVAAAMAVVCVVLSAIRGRWADVIACAVGVTASVVACVILRDDVFVRPAYGAIGVVNSFPSVHVVATLALGVTVLRLWPWAWGMRTLTALVIATTVVQSLVSVATFAHRGSDGPGAVLLVGVLAAVFARTHTPGISQALRLSRLAGATLGSVAAVNVAVAYAPVGPVRYAGFTLLIAMITGMLSTVVARIALWPA